MYASAQERGKTALSDVWSVPHGGSRILTGHASSPATACLLELIASELSLAVFWSRDAPWFGRYWQQFARCSRDPLVIAGSTGSGAALCYKPRDLQVRGPTVPRVLRSVGRLGALFCRVWNGASRRGRSVQNVCHHSHVSAGSLRQEPP